MSETDKPATAPEPESPAAAAHKDPQTPEGDAATAPADDSTAEQLAALPPEELVSRLCEAQMENHRLKDGLLRAHAEGENIRRRSQNESVAARKFAIEGFARELLSVKDSLDQAATVALPDDTTAPVQQMKEGLALTVRQFDSVLERFSVIEVEAAAGVPFDPQHHQAISTAPSDDITPDHIISVMQKGFSLKDRLLRPAMVVVAAPPK